MLQFKANFKLCFAVACPKEFYNVTWSATIEGEIATQICPRGAAGMKSPRLPSSYFVADCAK